MKKQILLYAALFLSFGSLYAQDTTYTNEDYMREMKEIFKGKWNCYYLDNTISPSAKKLISKDISFFVGENNGWYSAQAKFNYVINKILISEITLYIGGTGVTKNYFQLFITNFNFDVKIVEKNYSGIKCLSLKSGTLKFSPHELKRNGKLEFDRVDMDEACPRCCSFVFERVSNNK